ncbi:SIR2-like domain protein [uncultured archaeon]|nr:SIR2-like domain protein [uncultured archaeon]
MTEIKEVIILGAGASKSDGAPMQSELFKVFFEKRSIFEDMKISYPNRWNLVEEQEILIKDFFYDLWGIDILNYKNIEEFPTFEECMGMLDLANIKGQSFKGYDQEKINKTCIALFFLISYLLDNKNLKEINHKKLIERLKSENRLEKTAFISLNYDILIDNTLIDLITESCIDYGIEFINHKRPQDADKSVLLLKPHGSLNWLYCPTCNHIELFPKSYWPIKLFIKGLKENCKNCGTPMKFVIVPMTYFKEMSNPFIQQIFLKADEILRNADTIFFCGYSFPDADIHIKYLLKRAERFRGETPEIFVLNNHGTKTGQQKKIEKARFERFFRNKDKIQYTKKSFKYFVEKGI